MAVNGLVKVFFADGVHFQITITKEQVATLQFLTKIVRKIQSRRLNLKNRQIGDFHPQPASKQASKHGNVWVQKL